jgi:hypothetical protein
VTEHISGRPVSRATYLHHGCRCDGCCEMNTQACADAKARRVAIAALGHPDGVAVAGATYRNWGCRCVGCSTAHRSDMAQYRATRRRQGRPVGVKS